MKMLHVNGLKLRPVSHLIKTPYLSRFPIYILPSQEFQCHIL